MKTWIVSLNGIADPMSFHLVTAETALDAIRRAVEANVDEPNLRHAADDPTQTIYVEVGVWCRDTDESAHVRLAIAGVLL